MTELPGLLVYVGPATVGVIVAAVFGVRRYRHQQAAKAQAQRSDERQ